MLNNGYYDTQARGALKKAWLGYKIAINKNEEDNIKKYAKIILILQYELGLPLSDFSHVGVNSDDIDFEKEIEECYFFIFAIQLIYTPPYYYKLFIIFIIFKISYRFCGIGFYKT